MEHSDPLVMKTMLLAGVAAGHDWRTAAKTLARTLKEDLPGPVRKELVDALVDLVDRYA